MKMTLSIRIAIGMCFAVTDRHLDGSRKCQSKKNDYLVLSNTRTASRVSNLRCGPDRGLKM
jgi:hypothetical protein